MREGKMPEKILKYFVIEFPTAAEALADLPVDKALLYGDAADWY